jgi:cysteinyl-tRNA synthetase
VLGLDLHRVWDAASAPAAVPAQVQGRLDDRAQARADRDFARADALRAEIEAAGWEVVDGPDGSTVRPRA